jgi:16S rRNA G966 N2-methylase RsmD
MMINELDNKNSEKSENNENNKNNENSENNEKYNYKVNNYKVNNYKVNNYKDNNYNNYKDNNYNNYKDNNYKDNNFEKGYTEKGYTEKGYTEKEYIEKEPIILENINLEKYFPKNDIQFAIKNNKNLKITNTGLYSISKYNDAEWITNIILTFLNDKKITKNEIIDGTAGIGGNTISLSRHFPKVHAIEINKTHYNVLKNNLEALLIKNVDIYLDNFLNLLDKIKNNCNMFFFDPPWGGSKAYKNIKYFNLKIGNLPIHDIINILYEKNFKYIILKAPYNLNISPIFNNIKYKNMNIHLNDKKNMMLVIFY